VNLILLFESDRVSGNRFRIEDARAEHVRSVLRSAPGDTLRVGLLEGPLGSGVVTRIDDRALELDAEFEPAPPPRPLVDLLLAVPRPIALRRLLPQLTALGVDRLILLRTARVERSFLDATLLAPDQLAPLLHAGLMQARCTRAPVVTLERRFRPFVEDRVGELFGASRRLAAHPSAARSLSDVRFATQQRVALAVGPEGGWVPFEVELLESAGFLPVSLGPRVLRLETACVALLAQVALLRTLGGGAPCGSLDPT
jgi:RsmE family RNA methyltransferase